MLSIRHYFSGIAAGLVILTAWIAVIDRAYSREGPYGVVISNTFVITNEYNLKWRDVEGRIVKNRNGFIEIGKLVKKTGRCEFINGTNKKNTGDYCQIESEIGVSGYIKKDAVAFLENGQVYGFAVSDFEEIRFKSSAGKNKFGKFSKNSSPLVRFVGDWQKAGKLVPVRVPEESKTRHLRLEDIRNLMVVLDVESRAVKRLSFTGEEFESTEVGFYRFDDDPRWLERISDSISFSRWLKGAVQFASNKIDAARCAFSGDVVGGFKADAHAGFLKLSGKLGLVNEGKVYSWAAERFHANDRINASYDIVFGCTKDGVILGQRIDRIENLKASVSDDKLVSYNTNVNWREGFNIYYSSAKGSGLPVSQGPDKLGKIRMFTIVKGSDFRDIKQYVQKLLENTDYYYLDRDVREKVVYALVHKLAGFERSDHE